MTDFVTLEAQSRLSAAVEAEEMQLFSMLKPKLFIDGDQWCCMYGENLQDGISGFGDTPKKAVSDWNKQWNKPLRKGTS